MKYIKAKDGTHLYYKDWGCGKTVLFVHGWCLHSDSWEYIMNALCDAGYRCIAYDQRGCGRSDQPWSGYDLETLSSDLECVINSLKLSQIILVGHSMGCAVVSNFLGTRKSTSVIKGCLIGTTTPYNKRDETNPNGMDPELLQVSLQSMKADKPAYIRSLAEAFFNLSNKECHVSLEMVDWAVVITQSAILKAAIELQRLTFNADLRNLMPAIKIPMLLQHGSADVSSPPYLTVEPSEKLLPNCRVKMYKNHAHGVQISNWEQVAEDLNEFINE